MTQMRAIALTSACLLALGLAACGERGHKADDAASATPMSETVSEAPASSEDPATAVPASEASVRVPATSGLAAANPAAPTDLNDDEVAAAGDTRRRPAEAPAPSDTPQP